jgi:hypothetical protein
MTARRIPAGKARHKIAFLREGQFTASVVVQPRKRVNHYTLTSVITGCPAFARHDKSPHHQRHASDRLAIDQEPHRLRVIFHRQPVRDVGADFASFRPSEKRLQTRLA